MQIKFTVFSICLILLLSVGLSLVAGQEVSTPVSIAMAIGENFTPCLK